MTDSHKDFDRYTDYKNKIITLTVNGSREQQLLFKRLYNDYFSKSDLRAQAIEHYEAIEKILNNADPNEINKACTKCWQALSDPKESAAKLKALSSKNQFEHKPDSLDTVSELKEVREKLNKLNINTSRYWDSTFEYKKPLAETSHLITSGLQTELRELNAESTKLNNDLATYKERTALSRTGGNVVGVVGAFAGVNSTSGNDPIISKFNKDIHNIEAAIKNTDDALAFMLKTQKKFAGLESSADIVPPPPPPRTSASTTTACLQAMQASPPAPTPITTPTVRRISEIKIPAQSTTGPKIKDVIELARNATKAHSTELQGGLLKGLAKHVLNRKNVTLVNLENAFAANSPQAIRDAITQPPTGSDKSKYSEMQKKLMDEQIKLRTSGRYEGDIETAAKKNLPIQYQHYFLLLEVFSIARIKQLEDPETRDKVAAKMHKDLTDGLKEIYPLSKVEKEIKASEAQSTSPPSPKMGRNS